VLATRRHPARSHRGGVQDFTDESSQIIALLKDAAENMSTFWKKYDVDKSGTVDRAELAVLLKVRRRSGCGATARLVPRCPGLANRQLRSVYR
jgi:hypothetical protein